MPHIVSSVHRHAQRMTRHLTILLLLAALLLAACQPVQPVTTTAAPAETSAAALPQITITARDFAFDLPAEIPAGWVSLTLQNTGEANHHALFSRLSDGTTLDQVKEALASDAAGEQQAASENGDPLDGSNQFFMPDTDPGASNEATVYLAPGEWVIFSVSMADMTGADMRADWERGSIAQFTVTEADAEVTPPVADIVLTIGAEDADMPAEISAGTHTVQIVSGSGEPEASAFFVKLEGGATMEDVMAMFQAFFSGAELDMDNMPVFSSVGGLMGYNLSDSFYTTIDFAPGDYAAITSINADDFPYGGLAKSFTVK